MNNNKIFDISGMTELMSQVHQEKPEHIIFFVKRGIHTLFLELEPEWEQL